MKALQERLDIEKQTWEENYKKKEVCYESVSPLSSFFMLYLLLTVKSIRYCAHGAL